MRILIVRLSALGDIINSAPILQFIKQAYPDAKIEWVCEEGFAPIIEEHPLLHKVHRVSIKRVKKTKSIALLMQNIKMLRSLGKYDHIIDLQGLIKSAIVARLVGKNIAGFAKDSIREPFAANFYQHHTHIPYAENSIWRTCVLASDALNFTLTKQMLLDKEPALKMMPIEEPPTDAISFVIGASWPSKIYPKEKFVQLAKLLKAYKIVLIWGSEPEREDALYIEKNCENASLAPKLSLSELTSYIASTQLCIGNDTGPTHLAWAMNIPSITLFGPTPASKMIFETKTNLCIESDSVVDPMKLNREDFSIQDIAPEKIADMAKGLLHDQFLSF